MPLLFSYGTLQHEAVQMSTFGRILHGEPDELVGFERLSLRTDGETYSIVRFNGRNDSRVRGMVFEITDGDLAKADDYEPAPYKRVSALLASGKQVWVYADARSS